MSAVERKAWMTEALKMAYWWRANATTRQGVPVNPPLTTLEEPTPDISATISTSETDVTTTSDTTAATAATNSPSPGEGAAQQPGSSLIGRAAPLLLTALLGGGIPAATWALLHSNTPAPVVQQPVQSKDGHLLQWLQDEGHHLPEGAAWLTQPKK